MSDELHRAYENARSVIHRELNLELGFSTEDADVLIDELLDARAAILADRVRKDVKHIRYGCAADYAERHASLIYQKKES